jgi:hypothetical protein
MIPQIKAGVFTGKHASKRGVPGGVISRKPELTREYLASPWALCHYNFWPRLGRKPRCPKGTKYWVADTAREGVFYRVDGTGVFTKFPVLFLRICGKINGVQ